MTISNGLNRDSIGIFLMKVITYSCFKLFFIFLLLCHLLGTSSLTNASQEKQDTQRVLIVNSYHPGYAWSDDIMLGIRDVIGTQENVELIIEYLDTKRHFEKSYFQQLKELFRRKYKSADIDLVITSDDNALDFILNIRKELFPDVPLIFCGIDHIEPERIANQEPVYGIEEADSTSSTIDLILSIHPDIESIIFIADETSTGKLMLQKVRQIESTHQNKIHFQYIIGMSVEELQSTLKDIPDNTVIFYLSFIRDKNGKVFSIKDSMQLIADSANVPVYCSWGFQPETGVLGGNVLSGYKQGEISAKVGRRLLDGNSVEEIPVKQQAPLVYKFDYHAMNRFNIDEGILPQNSVIYNRPSSLYSEHKKLIWTTLFIILCLLAFIILLFLNIERRKKAETELRKAHGNLDQKVKIRTDELTKSNELLMEEIKNRKQAEGALEDSEALLAQTGRMAKVGGWILDAKTLEVTWTEETYRIHEVPLGHKPPLEEAINYFHSDDRPKLETAIKKAIEHGEPYDMEVRFITANGKRLWTHTIGKPTIMEGKTVKLTGTFQDITDRKQAEEALRDAEKRNRALLDHSPVCHKIVDLDFNLNYMSANGYKILKLHETAEVYGQPYPFEFFPAAFRNEMTENLKKVKETGDTITMEALTNDSEGNEIWLDSALLPVLDDDGRIDYITVVSANTTQRKLAEKEKERLEGQLQRAQKMEAMGTLAGGVAHDFNNLLMAIQGRTSIMLTKKDSSHPDIRHLKGIEDNIESAADLTRQLLGFARGGKYEVKPTDLNELVKKQNRMFGRTKKQISIRGKYEKDLWSVEVDRGQIAQVLLNLYVNAWQAMPAGGDLYLETENVTLDENYVKPFSIEPGRYVKISVTDTGTGMDKATREKIFEPFFTTKKMGRGTGLGLASVYGIIKNHGGFINVYSEKGHGTTFNIYLPASEKEIIEEKKSDMDTLRGSETVLFVDDEDMIIEVAGELFEQLGYKVLTARSGKEAIEIYEKNKEQIDIVLLDMIMPDMSGSDTYERMKAIDPDIKVLLSSGYSINGQATEIMDRGCNGFIQKPFKMKELSQKLREILDEK